MLLRKISNCENKYRSPLKKMLPMAGKRMFFGNSNNGYARCYLSCISNSKNSIVLCKKILFTASLLFCSTFVYPAPADIKVETTGYGETYRAALLNALLNAVGQVRGLQASTKEFLNLEFQQMVPVGVTPIAIQAIREDDRVSTSAKGWLKSYKVLSSGESSRNGRWVVELSAVVPQPEEKRLTDERKTLAVIPFKVPSLTFNIEESGKSSSMSAAFVSMRMAEQLRANFLQLGKFSVISQEFGSGVSSEIALLGLELLPASEAANLAGTIGADLILIGKIYRFETEIRKPFNLISHHVELYYQIVDVHAQKILWANTIDFDFDFDKRKQQSLEKQIHDDKEYSNQIDMLNALSTVISREVLSHIYPPKVISVKGKKIYLSHGGNSLKAGDILNVYELGGAIKEPDFGQPHPLDGEIHGVIEIIELRPEYAIGKLIEGDIGRINKKVVLRNKPLKSKVSKHTEEDPHSAPEGSKDL